MPVATASATDSRSYSLDKIFVQPYIESVVEVVYTDEFERWWDGLTLDHQEDVAFVVRLLEERGVSLGHPYSSSVNGSKLSALRELRIQSQGHPLRVFYIFDPERKAVLLIGGDKAGRDRFYEEMIPKTEKIYAAYREEAE